MAKDPAFLFYPGDWLGGTQLFSRSHKGAYMDILMAQYANGHMPLDDIKMILGSDYELMWESKLKSKFKIDDNGLYFNEKLDIEMTKRKNYTASRINNLSGEKKDKPIHIKTHMGKHMENGNENGNINGVKNGNEFCAENVEILKRLIEVSGRQFEINNKTHLKAIDRQRKKYSYQDCIDVVDLMGLKWKDDPKMEEYLRPSTLFAPKNFVNYRDLVINAKAKGLTASQIRRNNGFKQDKSNMKAEILEHIKRQNYTT